MISGIPIDLLFIVSVLLIWFMLLYQFILALAGYLYSRESVKKRKYLDRNPCDLPDLSILIPAHNEELVIERTLKTLLASDYPAAKIEIIVLNDGSTDGTAAILDRLCKAYPNLQAVHIPPEEGGKGKAA